METALDLSSGKKITGSIAVDKVMTKAAATPNNTRPTIKTSVFGANAQSNELNANMINAVINSFLRPNRSPNHPAGNMKRARANV